MAYDGKKIDLKHYVHLHWKNYVDYGIGYNQHYAKENGLASFREAHKELLSKITKIGNNSEEEVRQIENQMNRMLTGLNETDPGKLKNLYTEAEQARVKIIQQYLEDHFARIEEGSNLGIVIDKEDALTACIRNAKAEIKKFDKMEEDVQKRKDIEWKTLKNQLNTAQNLIDNLKKFKSGLTKDQYREVSGQVKKLRLLINAMASNYEHALTRDNSTGKWDIKGDKIREHALVGIKRQSYDTEYRQYGEFLSLIRSITYTFNSSSAITQVKGNVLEMMLMSLFTANAGSLTYNELLKIGMGSEKISVSNRAESALANVNMDYAGGKLSYHVRNKTDAVISFSEDGYGIPISAKNYNLFGAQKYGIKTVSETSLLSLLSLDFNENVIYHYFNVLAQHPQSDDNLSVGKDVKEEAITSLSLLALYHSLTGIGNGINGISQYFVVNNSSYKPGAGDKAFYIYDINQIIGNVIEKKANIKDNKLFSVKIKGVENIADMGSSKIGLINNPIFGASNTILKDITTRTSLLVADAHRKKVAVTMSPEVLDSYFNQKQKFLG